MNRNIAKIAILFFSGFVVIIFFLTYLQFFKSTDYLSNPNNKRLSLLENKVTRGSIIDRNGTVFAETVDVYGKKVRKFPLGASASNLTGYFSSTYGRTGIEKVFNEVLIGYERGMSGDELWLAKLFSVSKKGNNVVLTVDAGLQQLAYSILGNRKGSIVAIEPSTGRILAMVSKPGFNPETIETDWKSLTTNQDSPLLNRAAQGVYPPGSTMKVVTAAGFLESKPETLYKSFDAPGYIIVQGRRIEDKQAIGKISFTEAFARSSNYVFATIGMELGAKKLMEIASHFGLGQELKFDFPTVNGSLPSPGGMSDLDTAETAIGQGKLLVTPLQMAMVASAIANKGVLMKPYLIEEFSKPDNSIIEKTKPEEYESVVNKNIAAMMTNLMVAVTEQGTGQTAAIPGIKVAGKTGTAEVSGAQPHAWFIGFAPADQPKVAVAVIIENGGVGGEEAAPIAKQIMEKVIR